MSGDPDPRAAHWDRAYAEKGDAVSWHQERASISLALIAEVAQPDASVVDVGGGASPLVDALLDRGHRDVAVLDLSRVALDAARARLGARAAAVRWIAGDVLAWSPGRTFDVWHDRAVLHFLVEEPDRSRYAELAARTVAVGGHIIIATFAPDGPERCSGLPVRRQAPEDVAALLAGAFEPVTTRREEHRTPSGALQPFTWLVARRTP